MTPPYMPDSAERIPDEALVSPRNIRAHTVDHFTAWRVAHGGRTALPIDLAVVTMQDAISEAEQRCNHKDTLLIVHRGLSGRMLHAFAIKQSSKVIRVPHEDGTWRYMKPLKSAPLFSVPVNDFSPVEPFVWTRGCDVVGVRNNPVVEVQS
jgi:hypothetical protein